MFHQAHQAQCKRIESLRSITVFNKNETGQTVFSHHDPRANQIARKLIPTTSLEDINEKGKTAKWKINDYPKFMPFRVDSTRPV